MYSINKLHFPTNSMRVVLHSNSSLQHHPNNTLSNFTVQLPQTLDLSRGQYECGLSELQFHKSWYNITNSWIKIKTQSKISELILQDGFYDKPETLIGALNEIADIRDDFHGEKIIKFEYNQVQRSCKLLLRAYEIEELEFSPNLSRVLGYTDVELITSLKFLEQRYPKNTGEVIWVFIPASDSLRLFTIFNLMLYTDIVSSSIVSNVEAPLLRVVPVQGEHWQYQCMSFQRIQYLPLSKTSISSISVYIYTDYGEAIPFRDGKTVVTLDIRRVKPLHYI